MRYDIGGATMRSDAMALRHVAYAILMFSVCLRSRCDAMRFPGNAMRCKSELESELGPEYKSQSEKTTIVPMTWFAK